MTNKLSCYISEINPISYLQDGIKLLLSSTLVKHSPSLNRDANYLKTSRINKLVPVVPYIIIAGIPVSPFREVLLEAGERGRRHQGRQGEDPEGTVSIGLCVR